MSSAVFILLFDISAAVNAIRGALDDIISEALKFGAMDLDAYLQEHETANSLAEKLGISPVLVSQWRTGKRDVPIERCVAIERATGGEVNRWDLRPDDWHLIWPELIGSTGAPRAAKARAA